MKKTTIPLLTVAILIAASCAASSTPSPAAPPSSSQSFVITDEMIGAKYPPLALTKQATSADYGYTEKDPVLIGGGFSTGSHDIYSFLNALRGPQGQKVHYKRLGSCCSFKTQNSPFGGTGLLEHYEISYDGLDQPRNLYFNWYDAKEPMIPVGLSASR